MAIGQIPYTFASGKNNIMCNPCDFPSDFNVEKYQIFQGVPQMIYMMKIVLT